MWLLLIAIYVAPPDAVDWQGSWELGLTRLDEKHYASEKDCLDAGAKLKSRLNEGMLAPVRYHCIQIPGELPADVDR